MWLSQNVFSFVSAYYNAKLLSDVPKMQFEMTCCISSIKVIDIGELFRLLLTKTLLICLLVLLSYNNSYSLVYGFRLKRDPSQKSLFCETLTYHSLLYFTPCFLKVIRIYLLPVLVHKTSVLSTVVSIGTYCQITAY